ncbi:hypothetical protein KO566_01780 [Flavobacteriaceae bacterium XHP0103]|uniref:hypothetical protein n=1 Tax=Marixanthotalea marina TaxID=2844359 RepID=UPI002989E6C7|nr:hypothetical protein [Marixanthotalea marina]MBU3820776.1 hypothetical protein [Marixanthotalea marina]
MMLSFLKKESSYTPSNEERFVQYYLENNRIKYVSQYRLNELKGDDNYQYRDIDFYLPRLNIYVEYYGWYNKDKASRNNYDLKTKVLIKNDIPTIIIYPHELGFLDYAFHTKIIKLLKMPKFKNWKNTFIYKSNRYINNGKPYNFLLGLLSLFIALWALFQSINNYDIYFIIYLIGLGCSGLLFMEFFRLFYYILLKNE